MDGGISGDILASEGFRLIGALNYRLRLEAWWNAQAKIQLIIQPLGSRAILKGNKSYSLRSITEDGETYARDVGQLHDYLESHFAEVHLSFSHFRDISGTLAEQHIRQRLKAQTPTVQWPDPSKLATLQRDLAGATQATEESEALTALGFGTGGLLGSHLGRERNRGPRQVELLERRIQAHQERTDRFEHLQREYEREGSAASLSFSIHSNLQVSASAGEFRDALQSIVKELIDLHRYQVTQKLGAGRLNIHIVEADEPLLVWLEEWMGGALSPRQLARLEPAFKQLRESAQLRLMVTPKEAIHIDGHIQEDRKLLGAKIVSTLLTRLDRSGGRGLEPDSIPTASLPLKVGRIIQGEQMTEDDFVLPLAGANHVYVSGTTGCGKSFAGRVLIEEGARHEALHILVLDPRNQSAGLLVAEDRPAILDQYQAFALKPKDARGFRFAYFCPGLSISPPLPSDLGHLGSGRNIISFKGMDDGQRCQRFADILDAVFDRHADSESEAPRLLLVIEEAHRFTKKRVADDAKRAGERAELALDRTVREGRKFGCCVVILSQSIRDFAYDAASIRQNTNTKIFMHNSDREIEYAADFIDNGRALIDLPPATAFIHNAAFGAVKVRVRPPLSKVWEFSPEETRRLAGDPKTITQTLSSDARSLLEVIRREHAIRAGGLNVTELAMASGITSKRRLLALVGELERAGLARSVRLRERGSPRIVEPIGEAEVRDGVGTEYGTKPDGMDKT